MRLRQLLLTRYNIVLCAKTFIAHVARYSNELFQLIADSGITPMRSDVYFRSIICIGSFSLTSFLKIIEQVQKF